MDSPIPEPYRVYEHLRNHPDQAVNEYSSVFRNEMLLSRCRITTYGKIFLTTPESHQLVPIVKNDNQEDAVLLTLDNNTSRFTTIARLMAINFIPNINNAEDIEHIDGNPNNNFILNLKWKTKHSGARQAVWQTLDNGEEIWWSDLDAAAIGVGRAGYGKSMISRACAGSIEKAYGCKWEYEEIYNDPSELWRPIPVIDDIEGSTKGRLRNKRKRLIGTSIHSGYYRCMSLSKLSTYVHYIIACTFHGMPPDPKWIARHINGIKLDNRPENLVWASR